MTAKQLHSRSRWEKLVMLHNRLAQLVKELDEAELHLAAAHASSALEIMRREYPGLAND
jgi:hypothetical protein